MERPLFKSNFRGGKPQWEELPPGALEQRRYPRMRISLPGRFICNGDAEHDLVTADVSGTGLLAQTNAAISIGDPIVVRLTVVNQLPGTVVRVTSDGFAFRFEHGDAGATRIQRCLEALFADARRDLVDLRQDARIVPIRKFAAIVYNGEEHIVRILDVSISGARFAGAQIPPAGSKLRIGQREATVVRRTPEGAALQFDTALRPEEFGVTIEL